jgi:uncharacterized protein (TIGR03086 family)
MDTMESYRAAQDCFDSVLTSVPDDGWDRRSACTEWTVRDVAGHVIWGQRQLRAWATGTEFADSSGAPGSAHPAPLTGDDPVATWRTARAETLATLDERSLARLVELPGLGTVPVAALLTLLTVDHVTHAWDIGHAIGVDVRIEPALMGLALDWARTNVLRRPGFFGPEQTPPADADEQTRLLAFLGRTPWQPVPA